MRFFYLVEDVVPAVRGVPGDVAEGPDGLLLNVLLLRQQQRHEDRHRARLDHLARLRARPRRDVGQRPRRLELKQSINQ